MPQGENTEANGNNNGGGTAEGSESRPNPGPGVFCHVVVPGVQPAVQVALTTDPGADAADVFARATVEELHAGLMRQWAAARPEDPVERFRLLFRGAELSGGTLAAARVGPESTVHALPVRASAVSAAVTRLGTLGRLDNGTVSALASALPMLLPGDRDGATEEDLRRELREERQRRRDAAGAGRNSDDDVAAAEAADAAAVPVRVVAPDPGPQQMAVEEREVRQALHAAVRCAALAAVVGPVSIALAPALTYHEVVGLSFGVFANLLLVFITDSSYMPVGFR